MKYKEWYIHRPRFLDQWMCSRVWRFHNLSVTRTLIHIILVLKQTTFEHNSKEYNSWRHWIGTTLTHKGILAWDVLVNIFTCFIAGVARERLILFSGSHNLRLPSRSRIRHASFNNQLLYYLNKCLIKWSCDMLERHILRSAWATKICLARILYCNV